MIESRIKRALGVVSIVVALGYGSRAAYKLHYEEVFEAQVQNWNIMIEARTEECAREFRDYLCDRLPYWREIRREVLVYRNEAGENARQSLAIAIGTPIGLWSLFFLIRWIWTGRIRNSWSPDTEKQPFVTKQVLYWVLGILGCAFLFAVNFVVFPSGRAVQVLVKSAVQAIGLVFIVWVVGKIREVIQRRAERKRAAQIDPAGPPQTSGH